MRYVEPRERPPGPGRPLAGVLAVAVFLACFAGTNAWLRSALPVPATSLLARKLVAFEPRKDEIDTIFLGASTVYRHVDPAVFDAVLENAGEPSRSYNLGAAAMGGLEIRFALGEVLAMRPAGLRRVFIELQVMDLDVQPVNLLTGRVTWWHDLPTTWRAMGMLLARGRGGLLNTVGQMRDHLQAWFFNVANIGRARFVIEDQLLETEAVRAEALRFEVASQRDDLGPAADGFLSLDAVLAAATGDRRQQLVARRGALNRRQDEFRQKARAKVGWAGTKRVLSAAEAGLVASLARDAGAAGVELVFFMSPYVDKTDSIGQAAAKAGLVSGFLDMSRPEAHLELFQLQHRFDWNHLNERGARLFSRALAEAWLAGRDEADG